MKLLNHTKTADIRGASPKVTPRRKKMLISGIEQLSLQERQHTGKNPQSKAFGMMTTCGKPKLMVATKTLDQPVESVVSDRLSLDQLKREFLYRHPSKKRITRGKWKDWFIFQLGKGSVCVAPMSENGGGSPQASIAYTVATAPTQCTADSTLSGSARSQLYATSQKGRNAQPKEALIEQAEEVKSSTKAPTTTFGIARPDLGVRRRYSDASRALRATSKAATQNKPSEAKVSNKGNIRQQPSKIGMKSHQQAVKPEVAPEKDAKTTETTQKLSIRRNRRRSMPARMQRDKSATLNTDKTNNTTTRATKTTKTESQNPSVAKKPKPKAAVKRESPYKHPTSIEVNPVMPKSAGKVINSANKPQSTEDVKRKLGSPYKYRKPLVVNSVLPKSGPDNGSTRKTTNIMDNKTVKPTVQKQSATIPASNAKIEQVTPYKHRVATMRRSRKSLPAKQESISLEDHTKKKKAIPKVAHHKPLTTTCKTKANTPQLSLATSAAKNTSTGQLNTPAVTTTTTTTTTELLKGERKNPLHKSLQARPRLS